MSCQICNGHPNCPVCSPEREEEIAECYLCDGTGLIPGPGDTEEAPNLVECPRCNGDGVITYY